MEQLSLYDLWEKVLIKFFNIQENPDGTFTPRHFDNNTAIVLNEAIREDLFLVQNPFGAERTLKGYHDYYIQARVSPNIEPPRPNTANRYFLEAYARVLPNNPFSGSYVSYQFALEGKKLELKTESGTIETFVATRMVWIVMPKSQSECRVIGFGSDKRRYEGTGKIQENIINIKVRDLGTSHRKIEFDMKNEGTTLMQGHQTLRELNTDTVPSSRKMIWERLLNEFENLSEREGCTPCFFKNVEDLPKDFQQYVITAKEEDKPAPPQYMAEIDDLKAQKETLTSELDKVKQDKDRLELALKTQKDALETTHKNEKKDLETDLNTKEEQLTEAQKSNERRRRWIRNIRNVMFFVGLSLFSGWSVYYYIIKPQEKITWIMSSPWDGESSIRAKLITDIVAEVSKESKGRFEIQVYGNGYLPTTKGKSVDTLSQLFTAVSDGKIQMAHYSPYYSFKDFPANHFFCSMPGGMNHIEQAEWINTEGVQDLWQELYKARHVLPFSCGHTGEQMGGWFKKKILSTKDFENLKFRIGSPLGGRVLASFGAKIESKKIGEWQLVRKMAKNELDAVEFICAVEDYNLGMSGIRGFDFYYKSSWHEPNTMNAMIINEDAFNKLTPAFQEILKNAINKHRGNLVGTLKTESDKTEKFISDSIKEVTILPFPDAVETALRERSVEIVNKFIDENKKDPLFVKIYKSYKANCKEGCKDWKDITD